MHRQMLNKWYPWKNFRYFVNLLGGLSPSASSQILPTLWCAFLLHSPHAEISRSVEFKFPATENQVKEFSLYILICEVTENVFCLFYS